MTDTDFAFVIGHEMAHILREHGRVALGWRYVARPMMVASVVATGGATLAPTWLAHDLFYTTSIKCMEKEADLIALDLMAKSGYNPSVAGHMFEIAEPIMKKNQVVMSRIPTVFKTHPSLNSLKKSIVKNSSHFMKHYENHTLIATDLDTRNLIEFNARAPIVMSQLTHQIDGIYMSKADYNVKITTKSKDADVFNQLNKQAVALAKIAQN